MGASTGRRPAREERLEERRVRDRLRDDAPEALGPRPADRAAVDAAHADGIGAQATQRRGQLGVDDAADDGQEDLQRGLVGDATAGLEAAGDAEPLEPVGEALAATVDDDDGPPAALGDDLAQDVLLLGDGRAAELDDDRAARDRGALPTPCPRRASAHVE